MSKLFDKLKDAERQRHERTREAMEDVRLRIETERTAELFLSLAGTHSLVVVEHDMAFIETIARKVTVLHEGRVLAEGPMAQVKNDPQVIEVYLGR